MNLKDLQLSNISQVYVGKDACCRCGCGGEYYATSFMINPRSDVDDVKVLKLLERARKYDEQNKTAEYGSTYINVSMKNNRCICIYTDEVKK